MSMQVPAAVEPSLGRSRIALLIEALSRDARYRRLKVA
jgi:hypothetical protein